MKKSISDLGEKALLKRLSVYLGRGPGIIRTFSEDCSVIDTGGSNFHLYTVDAFVGGVHFKREYASAYLIGRKALKVNVSDISAMGGRPLYYLVSLMAPPDTPLTWIDELYRGMDSAAREAGMKLIGGNVTDATQIGLDLFVAGVVSKRQVVFRDGARVGDGIFVSGPLGNAAAGLKLLKKGHRLNTRSPSVRTLIHAHLDPPLRTQLARKISRWASSMIDVSDGVAADLREICRESGVGAVIQGQNLPLSPALLSVFGASETRPLQLALSGGEDYELLFTVPSDKRLPFLKTSRREKWSVFEIGAIMKKGFGLRLADATGRTVPLKGGYEHFSPPSPKYKE